MSDWLFDLGNSRVKCAPLHSDGAIGAVSGIDHDGVAFAPGWDAQLPARFDAAFVSSVAAPALTLGLLDTLTRRCGRISVVRTQAAFAGVRIAYAQPQRLGVDRFLALLAAQARARHPWLVVGVGTALTIDLIDGDGRHRGGRIAPSPTLMREALHARAAQLPVTGGVYDEFASDTADALVSGCEGAALGLIGRSVEAATGLLAQTPQLLLHGGGAETLLPQLEHIVHTPVIHAPALVLEGLARWARA
ncbi:MAG TPA: type III pantothenate kinase [Luteimonas sp.]|nr:type III pantothenate kinase [Luteimonas sp.]